MLPTRQNFNQQCLSSDTQSLSVQEDQQLASENSTFKQVVHASLSQDFQDKMTVSSLPLFPLLLPLHSSSSN